MMKNGTTSGRGIMRREPRLLLIFAAGFLLAFGAATYARAAVAAVAG